MHVAILGLGLIGGSVGLAARERLGAHVWGWDPDPAARSAAVRAGAIDVAGDGPDRAGDGQDEIDVVVVAAPVGRIAQIAAGSLASCPAHTVVTDVGSVKRGIVDEVRRSTDRADRFIGGHPLAGAETTGIGGARADLFDGATWYLTPEPTASGTHLERLTRFVAGLGARPQAIDAALHDRLMAAVSHLPHVVANVLVAQAAGALGADGTLPATGPSFRDATRVAGANTAMWTDIYIANRQALIDQIDETVTRLQAIRRDLENEDQPAIAAWNDAARSDRDALRAVGLTGGSSPQRELRVAVPNRPGVVADIALALGHAGININDMTLSPSADGRSGEVALWVAADGVGRAAALVTGLGLRVEGDT